MGTFLWLCRPGHIENNEEVVIRPYALLRMVINAGIGWIPILLYILSFWIG